MTVLIHSLASAPPCRPSCSPRVSASARKADTRATRLHSHASGAPHILLSGDWDTCDALSSTDDVFKFFARNQEITELTAQWKHVEDVMQTAVVTTTQDTPLVEAAAAMKLHGIGGMPVVDGGYKLVGLLCRSDARKGGATVAEAMTAEVVTVRPGDSIPAAADLMLQKGLDRLPVVDDCGRCVGILTRTDMFWTLATDNDDAGSVFAWHSGNV